MKLSFFGIPVHTILNNYPSSLISTSLCCDALALVTGSAEWARTGYHTLLLGCSTAAAAGAAGALDYLDVASTAQPEVQRRANIHAGLSAVLGGLFGFLLWQRSKKPDKVTPAHFALMTVGNVLLGYSMWNGSTMVYRYGIRVEREPAEEPVALRRGRETGPAERAS
jgi:uncharacterized membrane protein